MKSINEMKELINRLDLAQLANLDSWLDERLAWSKGNRKDCFVIMPFSMTRDGRSKDYWTTFFDEFLAASLASCGYRAIRAEADPGNIVKGIMQNLAWGDLVLAILTDFNANVWYELGVRHCHRRCGTIMACQDDQIAALPFDLKHHGIVGYSQSLDCASFAKGLQGQIQKLNEATEDSPVSGFLNSELTYCIHRSLAGKHEVIKRLRAAANDDIALQQVDQFNKDWAKQGLQVAVFKDDKVLRHTDVPVGTNANLCFKDAIAGFESQYPRMKSYGNGLWLGSIERCVGRITAVAYDSVHERGWLVTVEAHVKQGGL